MLKRMQSQSIALAYYSIAAAAAAFKKNKKPLHFWNGTEQPKLDCF